MYLYIVLNLVSNTTIHTNLDSQKSDLFLRGFLLAFLGRIMWECKYDSEMCSVFLEIHSMFKKKITSGGVEGLRSIY